MNTLDNHWSYYAACKGKDPSWWVIGSKESYSLTADNARALRICRRDCPVKTLCLDEAVRLGDHGVIRGGQVLRGKLERYPCETCGSEFLRTARSNHPTTRCPACKEQALMPHGTPGGYHRHKSRGEMPCTPCADAMAAYARARRAEAAVA